MTPKPKDLNQKVGSEGIQGLKERQRAMRRLSHQKQGPTSSPHPVIFLPKKPNIQEKVHSWESTGKFRVLPSPTYKPYKNWLGAKVWQSIMKEEETEGDRVLSQHPPEAPAARHACLREKRGLVKGPVWKGA